MNTNNPIAPVQPVGKWPLWLVVIEIAAFIVVGLIADFGFSLLGINVTDMDQLTLFSLNTLVLLALAALVGATSIVGFLWAIFALLASRGASNVSRFPAHAAIFLQCFICVPVMIVLFFMLRPIFFK